MEEINQFFDRLDTWRHFPNYQLERRADVFFSLYLREVLQTKLGFALHRRLIPEFPVRKGTIRSNTSDNRSYKIDYLAVSTTAKTVVLVELKTEPRSHRAKQQEYIEKAQEIRINGLLEGLLEIFRVTNAKRKYFCLLLDLQDMGLLRIPEQLNDVMRRRTRIGVEEALEGIEITAPTMESLIVYVQPDEARQQSMGNASRIITFEDFAAVVEKHDDAISQRFSSSLRTWAAVKAGNDFRKDHVP